MKVTYIADSTFVFEHEGIRLLTDPWIGTTIYGGSWVQFPKPTVRAEDIGPLDYIFISHIHEDHCDPATIAKLDRNATILLMERKPDFVEGFLKRHGFNFKAIRKIPAFSPVALSDSLTVETLDADPDHELNSLIDSALLLHAEGRTIYFSNDNPPYPRVVDRLRKCDVALALVLASGGSGYPACYASLSEEERRVERDRIVLKYFDLFADTVSDIRPSRFMACAGNHVLSGRRAALNAHTTFLQNPAAAYKHVYDRLSPADRASIVPLDLEEGRSWDMPSSQAIPAGEATEGWNHAMADRGRTDARQAFIENEAPHSPYDYDSVVIPPDMDWGALFRSAAEKMQEKVRQTRLAVNSRIYIRLPGKESYGMVDAMSGAIDVVDKVSEDLPYMRIDVEPGLLHELLTGGFSWNIADASGFLTYYRIPNIYDQGAVIALNYLRLPAPHVPQLVPGH